MLLRDQDTSTGDNLWKVPARHTFPLWLVSVNVTENGVNAGENSFSEMEIWEYLSQILTAYLG